MYALPNTDLQLTGVTCFFIASKNLEVDPLDLRTCIKTLCFNKYSKSHFLEKEADLRKSIGYENEAPTILDFIMLLLRLLKLQVQTQMDATDMTIAYIFDVQTIAYDLCKSLVLDANMLKYRPSVLATCLIFAGFQFQFEYMARMKAIDLRTPDKRAEVF